MTMKESLFWLCFAVILCKIFMRFLLIDKIFIFIILFISYIIISILTQR